MFVCVYVYVCVRERGCVGEESDSKSEFCSHSQQLLNPTCAEQAQNSSAEDQYYEPTSEVMYKKLRFLF